MSIQETKCPFLLKGKTSGGSDWLIPISASPFLIGRKEGCNLCLAVDGISRVHAEIRGKDDGWWISDCNSTNGTFVNRRRLTDGHKIKPGDVFQFGDIQFTVTEIAERPDSTIVTNPYARQFEKMMAEKAVSPYLQPIVRLSDLAIVGYEVLGRVHYQGLPESPGSLFQIARKLDREVELSQLFLETAFAYCHRLDMQGVLFFNMLPAEVEPDAILVSLGLARKSYPSLKMAMELHESVVTNVPMVIKLRQVLNDLHIALIYDDFGSGQARLVELMDAPPDVIKFDISLIHGIDTRPEPSQAIVASLVKMARDSGIKTLAEGVETQQEAEVCKRLGFELAQGFYYGRPARLADGDALTVDGANSHKV